MDTGYSTKHMPGLYLYEAKLKFFPHPFATTYKKTTTYQADVSKKPPLYNNVLKNHHSSANK
jgi:hypothetical protein